MHNRQANIETTRSRLRRLVLLALLLTTAIARGQDGRGRAIVIACDWDFAPYEFINNQGLSSGFNIDLLTAIFKEMNRPCKFVMNSRRQSCAAFENRDADLIVDYKSRYSAAPYHSSRSIVNYYNIDIAWRQGTPPVATTEQLRKSHNIALNASNDSISLAVMGVLADSLDAQFLPSREALAGLVSGNCNYFVWGREPLRWKIKELNLKDIEQHSLDLPAKEIHIAGHDPQLMADIDAAFVRLQQSGEIGRIRNRWLNPGNSLLDHRPSLLTIGITLAVALLVFLVYRLVRSRVLVAVRRNEDMEAMMHTALSMGTFSVMIIDLHSRRVTNHHGVVLPPDGVTIEQFMERIHPDNRTAIAHDIESIASGQSFSEPFNARWNAIADDRPPVWINVSGRIFAERDNRGRTSTLVITSRNVTTDVQQEQQDQELASKYLKMFNSTPVAMSFYSKEGYLVDQNANMDLLCGTTADGQQRQRKDDLPDNELLKEDFDPDSPEPFLVCHRTQCPVTGAYRYIELHVRPTHDDDGELLYYILTARDITDERAMYLELSRQDHALQEATAANHRYEYELRALLENCNMYVWHADPDSRAITFSRSLHQEEYVLTFQQYLDIMYDDEEKRTLLSAAADSMRTSFNAIHHFHRTPVNRQPAWYAVSGMPLFDDSGNFKGFFGITRDVTDLMETQQRLKEETARAENSGMLKSTFLANMTHEIRTPLNAIVGFSDLLHMVNSPDERKEFISIIRNNCDMLLRLISDIMEASAMDVKPLEIIPEEVDFAQFFDVISQSLAQRVQEPGVQFIATNPYITLVTSLDKSRIQQVITNFVTNAVKYTHEGHIKVGYHTEERRGQQGLLIYCEDTGLGIPKEKQGLVFDRFVKLNDFVQGTGLGLSICKSIAERSGGSIGVDSEGEGHGSTFWIWVPCTIAKQETNPQAT